MLTCPESYDDVVRFFAAKGWSFQRQVAEPLGTSPQYVRLTLKTYWGRANVAPRSRLEREILALADALMVQPTRQVDPTVHDPTGDLW